MHVIIQSWILFLWTITLTFVKSQEISCETPVIENGYVLGKKQEYNEHEVLHFMCDPPFQRTEDRPSKCTKFGTGAEWSPTPLCEPIKCRLSQSALEGTTYDPAYRNVFSPGDTLRVTCGEKYWISEPEYTSTVTTCGGDGEWTIRPVCQEVRCSNRREPHVYHWNAWRQIITLDTTVSYTCRSGYKSPDGRNVATCTRKGWTPDPLCQEKTCDPERVPDADPEEPFKVQYRYYDRVRYTCKEGFTGQFTLTCGERGWTGSARCTAITCDPERFPYADPEEPFKYQYSYNEEVRYICKEGYDGEFTRKCGERGWTGSYQCAEITCDRKDYPNADIAGPAKAKYKNKEEVNYNCKDGGQFTLTCGETGWTGSDKCSAVGVHCTPPPKVESAFVLTAYKDEYLSGSEVTYHCHDNYTMVGENTLQCKNGTWEKKNINCTLSELLRCGTPPFLEDGGIKYITKSHYDHNERVEYTCQTYYTMEGDPYKTCINGEWTGHMRCLKPCIAGEDIFRRHNITLKSNDHKYFTHDEYIEFKCTIGVPVGTVALNQRCNSGVIHLPTCQ